MLIWGFLRCRRRGDVREGILLRLPGLRRPNLRKHGADRAQRHGCQNGAFHLPEFNWVRSRAMAHQPTRSGRVRTQLCKGDASRSEAGGTAETVLGREDDELRPTQFRGMWRHGFRGRYKLSHVGKRGERGRCRLAVDATARTRRAVLRPSGRLWAARVRCRFLPRPVRRNQREFRFGGQMNTLLGPSMHGVALLTLLESIGACLNLCFAA